MRNLVWVLLLTVACSDSSPETTPDQSAAIDAEAITAAHCERLSECCSSDEWRQIVGADVDDVEACTASRGNFVSAFLASVIAEARDRRAVTVDTDAHAACVAAVASMPCEQLTGTPSVDALMAASACQAWVRPNLESSEFCESDFECKSGFCALGEAIGSCRDAPGPGEPCSHGRCGAESFCAQEVCAPKLQDGISCFRHEECLSQNCVEDPRSGRVCGVRTPLCQGN